MAAHELDHTSRRTASPARFVMVPLLLGLAAISLGCPTPHATTVVQKPALEAPRPKRASPPILRWRRVLVGNFNAVAGRGDDDVWLVGGNFGKPGGTSAPAIAHWNGEDLVRVPAPTGAPAMLEAVAMDKNHTVWIAGRGQIASLAPGAKTWTTYGVPNGSTSWCCRSIARVGDEGWMAGPRILLHHTSAGMSLDLSGDHDAFLANAVDDVFRANPDGVFHWDGLAWKPLPLPPAMDGPGYATAYAIWGKPGLGPWVTLGDRTVAQWTGVTWRAKRAGDERRCGAISGVAADDIWCAGESGVIAHFDGVEWTRVDGQLGKVGESWSPDLLAGIYATARRVWVAGREVWVGER